MHSAIYQGTVRHRRMQPAEHEFSYRMFMMYLDLSELATVFASSRWFSASKRAAARFCREDHLGDPTVDLDTAVRDLVAEHTGRRPEGPVRLLTHLRYFGYVFNPVSFYYCFDRNDQRLETIVAEVNNTPWGERHCYVLNEASSQAETSIKRYQPKKAMHVSPFMPMEIDYDWRFRSPGSRLTVHMQSASEGRKVFDATLDLQRREIGSRSLVRVLVAFPLMTLKVITAIHWQALLLWIKRVPVIDHSPRRSVSSTATSVAARSVRD